MHNCIGVAQTVYPTTMCDCIPFLFTAFDILVYTPNLKLFQMQTLSGAASEAVDNDDD